MKMSEYLKTAGIDEMLALYVYQGDLIDALTHNRPPDPEKKRAWVWERLKAARKKYRDRGIPEEHWPRQFQGDDWLERINGMSTTEDDGHSNNGGER